MVHRRLRVLVVMMVMMMMHFPALHFPVFCISGPAFQRSSVPCVPRDAKYQTACTLSSLDIIDAYIIRD